MQTLYPAKRAVFVLMLLFFYCVTNAQTLIVKTDGVTSHGALKVGYVDESGKWVIKPKLSLATPFSGPGFNNQYAYVHDAEGNTRIIDKTGKIIMGEYMVMDRIAHNDRYVTGNKRYSKTVNGYNSFIFDLQNGNTVWLPENSGVDDYGQVSRNFIIVKSPWNEYDRNKIKYGALDAGLKLIIPIDNENISYQNGFVSLKKGGLTAVYDSTLNKMIDFKYKEVKAEAGGKTFLVEEDDKTLKIDAQDKILRTFAREQRYAERDNGLLTGDPMERAKLMVENSSLDRDEALKLIKGIDNNFKNYKGDATTENDSVSYYNVNGIKIWTKSQHFTVFNAGARKGAILYKAMFRGDHAKAMGGGIGQLKEVNDPNLKVTITDGPASREYLVFYKNKVCAMYTVNMVSLRAELDIGDLAKM